jgi:hypothetical protein
MSQLDIFHADAGAGWYSVGHRNKAGEGGGACRWFDSEDDAIAYATAQASGRAGYKPYVCKLEHTPYFAQEREAAWTHAAKGRSVVCERDGIFLVDGERLRISRLWSKHERKIA